MPLITRGLLFTHIPKTAGTSLRVSMKKFAYGWKVYADYDPKSSTTSDFIKSLYQAGDFSRITEIDTESTLLAGHFPFTKYIQYYHFHKTLTFMRDPVQRVISHYHDMQRRIGYTDSLETFIHETRFQNIQSKYFEGVPLEAIGIIGISEFYDESVDLINRSFSLNLPVRRLNGNAQKKEAFYLVPGAIAEKIQSLNAVDMDLYRRAMRIFLTRQALAGKGLPYVYGKIDSIVENTIKGWAVNPLTSQPVKLKVMLNDRLLTQASADQPAPELKKLNMGRDGQVGFRINLDKPLSADNKLEVRVAATNQLILP